MSQPTPHRFPAARQPTVALVGYQDHPNLGIGYLAAVLMEHGFDVEVLDFRLGKRAILDQIRACDPLIVGLSVIFQYYTPAFGELSAYLKQNDVTALICAGGHYPSLRHEETLAAMPGLDCVVRFEGEYTLLELAQRLAAGDDWRSVDGIAYRANGRCVETALRPLIPDLDALPFPYRTQPPFDCLDVKGTCILASRGCPRNCSFCSIRRFYAIPPGKPRRLRSPSNVIAEMLELYHTQDVRLFLFQDDDFSFMSRRDRLWIAEMGEGLRQQPFHRSILWKINCRADEVEPDIFAALQTVGLAMVYLGLESGNEAGLAVLNKQITVEQNWRAVQILNDLGLHYEYGFMLFDPSSTFDRVLENIRFLRAIGGDGSAPIPFGRMAPYAGTDIEDELRQEGRLCGDVLRPDYTFLEERLHDWFDFLAVTLEPWANGENNLLKQLRWALLELDVMNVFYRDVPWREDHQRRIRFLIQHYNDIFCRIVEDSAEVFQADTAPDVAALQHIRLAAETQRQWLAERLEYQRTSMALGLPQPVFA